MWWPSSSVCCRFNFPSCLQSQKARRVWPLLIDKQMDGETDQWKPLSFSLFPLSPCHCQSVTWGRRGTCRPDPPLSTSATPWRRRGLTSCCRHSVAAGTRRAAPNGAQTPPTAAFLRSGRQHSRSQTAGAGEERNSHTSTYEKYIRVYSHASSFLRLY